MANSMTYDLVRCVAPGCGHAWSAQCVAEDDGRVEHVDSEMACPNCGSPALPTEVWDEETAREIREAASGAAVRMSVAGILDGAMADLAKLGDGAAAGFVERARRGYAGLPEDVARTNLDALLDASREVGSERGDSPSKIGRALAAVRKRRDG